MNKEIGNKRNYFRRLVMVCPWNFQPVIALIAVLILFLPILGQKVKTNKQHGEKTILVTAVAHNDRTRSIAERLQPSDFAIKEKGIPQQIVSVRKVAGAPLVLAVLIQDNLVLRVNNELRGIKDFIKGLPDGSSVMTAYISTGSLRVKQDFTNDLEKAGDSLRIITSSSAMTPYSPYIQIKDAMKRFKGQPEGRRVTLLVSDGLDYTSGLRWSSPFFSAYLDGAIYEAQRRGVALYPIYAPPAGRSRFYRRAINAGQGSLLRLADETGGEAFFSGSSFVTFSPYFKEFNEILNNQWLITYRSNNTDDGFRKIEVTTDFDINLQHPAGYRVKK